MVETKLAKLVAERLACRSLLARLMVAGGTGWVSDTALRLMDTPGLDRSEVLSTLRGGQEVSFTFGEEKGRGPDGSIFWDGGTIKAYVRNQDADAGYRLEGDCLSVQTKSLPATLAAGLTGRRLRTVVDLHDFADNTVTVNVDEKGSRMNLHLETGRSLVEERCRRIYKRLLDICTR